MDLGRVTVGLEVLPMVNAAFQALCDLRSAPNDRLLLDRFLIEVHLALRRLSKRVRDPDDVASVALLKIRARWATCRAEGPGRFGSWLRQVVWRCAADLPTDLPYDEDQAHQIPDETPDPHEQAVERGRGRAIEEAIEAALHITPADLPARHRAWARQRHVAATGEGIRRDVEILLAVRLDERPVGEVAETRGISVASVHQAKRRGAAALALAARIRAPDERDPLVREGLEELVRRQLQEDDAEP